MRHLLIVSEYWWPAAQGGGERSAFMYAKALVQQGWAVSVLTSKQKGASVEELVEGVRILRWCTTGKADTTMGNIRRETSFVRSVVRSVRAFAKNNAIDNIHLMNTTALPAAPLLRGFVTCPITAHLNSAVMFCPKGDRMRFGKECDIVCTQCDFMPCYAAAEGLGRMGNPWWLRHNPLVRQVLFRRYSAYERSIQAIDGWLAIGSGLVALAKLHNIAEDKILLLSNPIDMNDFLQVKPPRMSGPLKVGYVGVLTEAKGVRVLLEALTGLDAKLHVAGTGPLSVLLASQSAVRVTLHGQLRDADMPSFYAGVDVVVVPSLCAEAFGRVAVEAMASARSVVVSDIGGLRDIVKGCSAASLVEPGSSNALAASINKYVQSPRRCAIDGKRCREHVRRKYVLKSLAATFSSFLRDAL